MGKPLWVMGEARHDKQDNQALRPGCKRQPATPLPSAFPRRGHVGGSSDDDFRLASNRQKNCLFFNLRSCMPHANF